MRYQLFESIENYLTGRYSIQDLEASLMSNLQDILNTGDQIAIQVANDIDSDLVEFGENLIDESTFRGRLVEYAYLKDTIHASYPGAEPAVFVETSSNNATVKSQETVPAEVVTLRLAHTFA